MKKLTLVLLLLTSLFSLAQKTEKETVYLLFDTTSNEKYIIEDGSGNSLQQNRYRKEINKKFIKFKICNDLFLFNKMKNVKDTCTMESLKGIKTVDFNYLEKKHAESKEFKHHVFEKIYFIEKISRNRILKYEVIWVDDTFITD